MKDIIEITNDENEIRQVEVVTLFNMEGSDYNYIIYKELDGSHTYVAKYIGTEIVNLDTNLSDEEFKFASAIYRGVK